MAEFTDFTQPTYPRRIRPGPGSGWTQTEFENRDAEAAYSSGRAQQAPRPGVDGQYGDPFRGSTAAYQESVSSRPTDYWNPVNQLERMEQAKPVTQSTDYRMLMRQMPQGTSEWQRDLDIRNAQVGVGDPMARAAIRQKMREGYAAEDQSTAQYRLNAYQQALAGRAGVTDPQVKRETADQVARTQIANQGLGNSGYAYGTDAQERTSNQDRDFNYYAAEMGNAMDQIRAEIDRFNAEATANNNAFGGITDRMTAEANAEATRAATQAGLAEFQARFQDLRGGDALTAATGMTPLPEGGTSARDRQSAEAEARKKKAEDLSAKVTSLLPTETAAALRENGDLRPAMDAMITRLVDQGVVDPTTATRDAIAMINTMGNARITDAQRRPMQLPIEQMYVADDADRDFGQKLAGWFGNMLPGVQGYAGFSTPLYNAQGDRVLAKGVPGDKKMMRSLPNINSQAEAIRARAQQMMDIGQEEEAQRLLQLING